MMDTILAILASSIRLAIPYTLAGLGGTYSERSGVVNIGLEGMMLTGAFTAVAVTNATGSAWLGLLAAIFAGMLLGLIHGVVCVTFKADQIVSGLALTMFGVGISALFGRSMVGLTIAGFERVAIPGLSRLPVIGKPFFNQDLLIYFSFLLVIAIAFFFYRTRWGLALRTVGENPAAADTCGIPVLLTRFMAVTIGSGIVGIGGAYLCVYGMEGPGGYQFVGRTVQMWNRYRQTADFSAGKQWLLRFFDQLRFYPVSHDELTRMREDFI